MNSNVWNMDLTPGQHKRSWWWWFWLFFMENPENPNRPKQLAVMWSTKDCDKFRINETWWHRRKKTQKMGNQIIIDGAVGAWYYDGKKMKEPVILDKRFFAIRQKENHGILTSTPKPDYYLSGRPGEYKVHLENKNFKFHVDLTSTNDTLSDEKFSENSFYFGYGFDILKICRMNLKGVIKDVTTEGEVAGTAYFQKVRISAPIIPPWYWGTIHMQNGSYLQYYMLHLGPPMFRRKKSHKSNLDWGEKYISKSISFYSKELEKSFEFKNPKISKHFDESGLPIFKLEGMNKENSISFTLNSYSRATWYFEQPMLRFIKTVLYYNEYPVTLSKFSFKGQDVKLTEKDVGTGVGNCEHAWGCLI
ncbi:MAG: hypothetical protein JSW00_11935 [Thermoplasmata archaeon]|nr:MAG: hypothetical protein JSW00_11935 [Thermoplasmata archaeon]